MTPEYGFLSIGFGGWSMHSLDGNVTRSHYGDTWRDHLGDLTPDAIAVDLTVCEDVLYPGNPSDALAALSIRGPMVRCNVEPGTVSGLAGVRPLDWNAPYAGAGSFGFVHPSDYARMARAIGARVFNPHQEAEVLA